MLTVDILRANSVLGSLTDEQLRIIAEMSRNDEQNVINTRIGALHGQYDTDVLGVTGIKKNDGEKSYDYVKRVLGDYKVKYEKANSTQAELDSVNKKVAELTKKLEDNSGDEHIKKQLKDAQSLVTQLQTQLTQKTTEYDSAKQKYETDLKDVHVNYAFSNAITGLKFKAGIPESVQRAMLNVAKAEVLAKGTPDFVDDGNGRQILVMRDNTGNILNNVNNGLKPYTIAELIAETSLKDIIDTGRKQDGGGTGGNNETGGRGSFTFDLSGAKNQIEADRMIEAHLLSLGLTRDSMDFQNKSMELRAENNVSELPIR